jgi:DNA-binding response OmpR family regulator
MPTPRTVLLVDDNPDLLTALRSALEARGYRVLTAGDGPQGLAVARAERPELVVLDMMLPRKSGFAVLDELKGSPNRSPHVIMITATEGAAHRAYAHALGVDDYLSKPFPLPALLERIDRLCPAEAPRAASA